jgi:hypothetical protein
MRALPSLRLNLPAKAGRYHLSFRPPFGRVSRVRQPRVSELRCPFRKGDSFGTEKVTASFAGQRLANNKEKTMTKAKPTSEIRVGKIKAAIWANETENGIRYNVTFSRLYKDGEGWKRSESFSRDDLLVLAKLADQVHSVLYQQLPEPEEEPAV